MSGKRKIGNRWYLIDHYYVEQPDPNDPTKTIRKRKQRATPVSNDFETFKEFREEYDHGKRRRRHGLANDRASWAQFVLEIQKQSVSKKESTRARDALAMKHFKNIVQPHRMSEITVEDCLTWLARRSAMQNPMTAKAVRAGTVRSDYLHLKAAFNKAVLWGFMRENPLLKIDPPRVGEREEWIPSDDQVNAGIEDCLRRNRKDYWLLFLLFADAGLRLDEAAHARLDWVDLPQNKLLVKNWPDGSWTTKNYRNREIPLTKRLQRALDLTLGDFTNKGPLLVPALNGTIWKERSIEKAFVRIFRGLRMTEATVHRLRHYFATRMHRRGVRVKTIQKWMGHYSMSTTETYIHVDDKEGAEEMRRAENG